MRVSVALPHTHIAPPVPKKAAALKQWFGDFRNVEIDPKAKSRLHRNCSDQLDGTGTRRWLRGATTLGRTPLWVWQRIAQLLPEPTLAPAQDER